jgi:hypothetical protein
LLSLEGPDPLTRFNIQKNNKEKLAEKYLPTAKEADRKNNTFRYWRVVV